MAGQTPLKLQQAILAEHPKELEPQQSRLTTILQGLFIISLGGAFSYGGFKYGLNRSIEKAKHDFDDKRLAEIDPNKVGPSGIPARQLAMKAFARGSAGAFVMAAVGGFGLSYVVEAKHRGVSKEQEDREMDMLYKELGIVEDMNDYEKEVSSSQVRPS